MQTFADIARELESHYLVKHIMIPVVQLVYAHDEKEAREKLKEYPDFNIIPIRDDGKFTSYVERDTARSPQSINLYHDIVGDGTTILRLIEIFCTRDFVFVLADNSISGYIHFSDLNHRLVNVALFTLVSAFEFTLAKTLSDRIDQNNFDVVLNREQRERVNAVRWGNAELNWTTALLFMDILQIANNHSLILSDELQMQKLNDIRNRICHAPRLLIEKREDIRVLASAKKVWQDYLFTYGILRR